MKITVFTSNQPRHLALIGELAKIADEVFAVQECNTIFPGEVADFYAKSEVMRTYFSKVIAAEEATFGGVSFSPRNARLLSIKAGDLNRISMDRIGAALQSDVYVVFGASFIKGPLIEFLVANRAINIHMGLSPFYRGTACNFWAQYDKNPDYVGATLHLLSKGLDSGDILSTVRPKEVSDPFRHGMEAVKSAHKLLVGELASGRLTSMAPQKQDRTRQIRYTRNADFTDEIAAEYLARL